MCLVVFIEFYLISEYIFRVKCACCDFFQDAHKYGEQKANDG